MGYDIGMLAVLAYTTFRGAAKGIAWQVAAIAALVLCFVFATPASLVVAPMISLDPPLNRWVAMLAVYLAFSFACFAAARLLRGWLEALKFEEYDRHLGALFGLLKGATLCLVITFFTVCLVAPAREYVLKSRSGKLAAQTLEGLTAVTPKEFDKVLAPYLKRFDEAVVAEGGATDEGEPDDWNDDFRGSVRPEEEESDSEQPAGDFVDRAVDAIQDKIRDGVKDLVRDVLDPESDRSDRSAGQGEDDPDERSGQSRKRSPAPAGISEKELDGLVAAVSRVLSRSSESDERNRSEIDALIRGIPSSAAAAALRDWRADLLGDSDDPDPETDVGSSLDLRIWRQLTSGGHDPDELPRPLRERLREAAGE